MVKSSSKKQDQEKVHPEGYSGFWLSHKQKKLYHTTTLIRRYRLQAIAPRGN